MIRQRSLSVRACEIGEKRGLLSGRSACRPTELVLPLDLSSLARSVVICVFVRSAVGILAFCLWQFDREGVRK